MAELSTLAWILIGVIVLVDLAMTARIILLHLQHGPNARRPIALTAIAGCVVSTPLIILLVLEVLGRL